MLRLWAPRAPPAATSEPNCNSKDDRGDYVNETPQSKQRNKAVKNKNVAIVGATGAVGREFVGCIESRGVPLASLKLLASAKSAGKTQSFRGKDLMVEELTEKAFEGVDIALFSAGSGISKQFAPIA